MIEPLLPVAAPPRAVLEDHPADLDPIEGLRRVRHRRHPALLLSGLPGHGASRFSILAWDPVLTLSIHGGEARVSHHAGIDQRPRIETRRAPRDPFDLLRALAPAGALQRPASGVPFAGGAIGYLGYGLRRAIERLPAVEPDPSGAPDAWFGLYDRAVVFDHLESRVVLVSTGLGAADEAQRERRAQEGLRDLRGVLRSASRPAASAAAPAGRRRAHPRTRRAAYLQAVERALRYIGSGDVYQVNLSHRIECPFDGDPVELFSDLARRNPAPFAAFLETGDVQIVSASPERFVSLHGSRTTSGPIKGTRPRGATTDRDRTLARDLLESPKDRAENVMIADLMRNDLGRVCETGSVRVERLCALESFATVHHLVTTVSGRLRPETVVTR